ncbi:hypothetical protein MTR67_017705 [Solanum verrucosum]|uniref:Uncharacterized protein n=1 Tax=Solanum verrucosum TaxID=315347 RepID=A0AAF0QKZ8_SOLVR|nr:hypothetical protein MTR67_017705 [Solanum verrucosum]
MRIRDSSSEQSNVVAGTPPLTQHYVHPGVSPTPIPTPTPTPYETSALAPGQRDRIDRVIIEPDGSSWYPAKDVVRALKDSTICTWEPRFNMVIAITFERRASVRLSSWLKKARDTDQCPGWTLTHVFDELHQYWNTDKFKAMSNKPKRLEAVLRVTHCTLEVQRALEQLQERWKKKWGALPCTRGFQEDLCEEERKAERHVYYNSSSSPPPPTTAASSSPPPVAAASSTFPPASFSDEVSSWMEIPSIFSKQ